MKRIKRSGRKYPRRKLWVERRDAAFARAGDRCEITGEALLISLSVDKYVYRRAAHHILAEKWVRRFCVGADPHILENLIVTTPRMHSRLTAAENCLFQADWLGYRSRLHQLGFRLEVLDQALTAVCKSVPEK